MDVRRSNFAQALESIWAALQEAAFVAIDLEFTGIQVATEVDSYADTASERLEKACRIVESFAPIQLGITICSNERKLSSYSIMMAPESTFLCDVAALKFVRRHNVDLNAWVDEGVRHVSNEEAMIPVAPSICQEGLLEPLLKIHEQARGTAFLCQAERLRAERSNGLDINEWVEAQLEAVREADAARFSGPPSVGGASLYQDLAERQAGLPRLWQMLKQAQKPLVVHCGLLDVLFLLATFEQRTLPREPTTLARLIKECLPSGIFDTAFLHESAHDLRLCPLGLHGFAKSAREHHHRRHGCEQLPFELERLTAERYGIGLHNDGIELTHEAGYDSFLTAVLISYLKESHPTCVKQSLNRFYLHKSTDCLHLSHLRCPAGKATFAIKVYDSERLVVAELRDQDSRENTANRISEVRRTERDNAFFYRKIDEGYLLIPGCEEAKLVTLSSRLPGVTWKDFYTWQKQARATRNGMARPPDRGRQFVGMIKSFAPERGYGFIHCQDAFRIYGCDVFLHQLQATGFQEGQHVHFVVACNDKGQPQARDLEECIFTGVIRSIDPESRFAAIRCPVTFRMHSCDVIVSIDQLYECQVGAPVIFSVVLMKGRLVARRVLATHTIEQHPARLQQNQQNSPSYFGGVQEFAERFPREHTRSEVLGNLSGLQTHTVQAPGRLSDVRQLITT